MSEVEMFKKLVLEAMIMTVIPCVLFVVSNEYIDSKTPVLFLLLPIFWCVYRIVNPYQSVAAKAIAEIKKNRVFVEKTKGE